MMTLISILVFSGAMAASSAAIAMTVAPQWRRIAHLAMGNVEHRFAPLGQLAVAERRIAVRRWASESSPSQSVRLRAAA
jgi:hypothetical protein